MKAKVMDQLKFVFKDESEFDLTILDGILEELPDNINSDRETFANLTQTYINAAKSYKDSDYYWFYTHEMALSTQTIRGHGLNITLKAFN